MTWVEEGLAEEDDGEDDLEEVFVNVLVLVVVWLLEEDTCCDAVVQFFGINVCERLVVLWVKVVELVEFRWKEVL